MMIVLSRLINDEKKDSFVYQAYKEYDGEYLGMTSESLQNVILQISSISKYKRINTLDEL